MLKKCFAMSICAAALLAALTSCGDSKAGGTGEFTTVFVTATPPNTILDSDLAQWVDASGKAASACVAGNSPTFTSDDVNYSITSTAYNTPNTGQSSPVTASDLLISRITLTLTPANTNTPPLPARFQLQYLSAGQRISTGTTTIPIRVVSEDLKAFIASQANGLCPGPSYAYRATVSFEAVEINTNRAATITPKGDLLINLKDFVDAA